ncbi:MAG: hypothetical protein ACRDPE_09250 [Solirubrobacterales bacterium]
MIKGSQRWVDRDKLVRVINDADPGEIVAKVRRWLEKQPTAPDLVGRKVAAEIIGVHSPYISRLEEQGRMPEAVPVEGTAPAYIRAECERLGEEIRKERDERDRRRKEKETAG